MTEITGRRLGQLLLGRCPECQFNQWQPGPRGGASQNFECAFCQRRFNLVISGRSVLFAHAIDARPTPDDWQRYREVYEVGPLFAQRAFVDTAEQALYLLRSHPK